MLALIRSLASTVTLVAILFLNTKSGTISEAFSIPVSSTTKPSTAATSDSALYQTSHHHYPHHDFHRAVECAQDPALCDIDEMLQLADELEKYDQCFFEEEATGACEKEKADRQDVAELLRLESEVILRGDYLVNANLFAEDVERARLRESWDDHKQSLDAYSNY